MSAKYRLPVIDIRPLYGDVEADKLKVAHEIGKACRTNGFFYVIGHAMSEALQKDLLEVTKECFAEPFEDKMKINIALSGKACRGYVPFGQEYTSGSDHDHKEGIYFSDEYDENDSRVLDGLPLHGSNQFPINPSRMKSVVYKYMEECSKTCQVVLQGIALSLGLRPSYFYELYTHTPTRHLLTVHYPPLTPEIQAKSEKQIWGIPEHTDFGLITAVFQDDKGGLQVKTNHSGWIDAVPVPGSLIFNIGDMLDKLTKGVYRSTPHRVRCHPSEDRYSFPFFFDPAFDAEIIPLPTTSLMALLKENNSEEVTLPTDDKNTRWDGRSVHEISGKFGKYLTYKMSSILPVLKELREN